MNARRLLCTVHSVYLTLGRFDSARSLVRMQDMRCQRASSWLLADIAAAAGDDELTRKHLENWQRPTRLEGQKRRPALFLLARSGLDLGMVRTRPPNLSPRLTNLYRLNDGMLRLSANTGIGRRFGCCRTGSESCFKATLKIQRCRFTGHSSFRHTLPLGAPKRR